MGKASWYWILAALLLVGVAPAATGCGDDDDDTADGDADADTDADSDADTDADADGDCSTGDPEANGGCDWTCNDATQPDFKLTSIDVSAPTVLASDLVQGIITSSLDDGSFVWLLENDAGAYTTGTGLCDDADDSMCEFDPEATPATGNLDYDEATGAFRVPAGTDTLDVTVVIHSETAGDIPLALHEGLIEGTTSHDSNCVGSRTNNVTPSRWDTAGNNVEGKITVEEAEEVDIAALGQTLCDLLSAKGAGFCAANPDPTTWPDDAQRPDSALADGTPTWTLRATFAAIGVHIE